MLHERNVVLTVAFHDEPVGADDERVAVEPLGHGFWRVRVALRLHGDARHPGGARRRAASTASTINLFGTRYFLSRETVVPTRGAAWRDWRESLFATMARNAGSVAEFFRLPANCVVELGTRVAL